MPQRSDGEFWPALVGDIVSNTEHHRRVILLYEDPDDYIQCCDDDLIPFHPENSRAVLKLVSGPQRDRLRHALERADRILVNRLFCRAPRPQGCPPPASPHQEATLLELWVSRFGDGPVPVVLWKHGALWWPARLGPRASHSAEVRIDFFGEPPTYDMVPAHELICFSREAAVKRRLESCGSLDRDSIGCHELERHATAVVRAEAYIYGAKLLRCSAGTVTIEAATEGERPVRVETAEVESSMRAELRAAFPKTTRTLDDSLGDFLATDFPKTKRMATEVVVEVLATS